jgi:hypothetical protein
MTPGITYSKRDKAFATITALAIIGLIGVTLATLTALFARDVKRSLRLNQDAQLRQLLIAGELAARESLGAEAAGGEVAVTLPQDLQSAGLSLAYERLSRAEADGVEVRVTARGADNRSVSQTLAYVKGADGWKLRSAGL